MGRVIAPYGVRGWIKVRPFTESPDGLLGYGTWWLGGGERWQAYPLMEGRAHGALLVARLEGMETPEQAAVLKGATIAVPREALPDAGPGEYYWTDLIGLDVVNREEVALGRIAEVFETGANDVLVVRGERERLIPFIGSVIEEVDMRAGRVRVDWGADY